MKFTFEYMPYSVANNIQKQILTNKMKGASGTSLNDVAIDNKDNDLINTKLKTDYKSFEKNFKRNHDVTFFSVGENSYIGFEISFVTRAQIEEDPELFSVHLEHLTYIFKEVEDWFFEKFNKHPLTYSINATEDVPKLILIFDNYREISNNKYKASSSTFFEFNRRVYEYEELRNVKKITLKVKKQIVEKIKYEFWERFGTIKFSKYLN